MAVLPVWRYIVFMTAAEAESFATCMAMPMSRLKSETIAALSRLFLPRPDAVRKMLEEYRAHCQLTNAEMAAMLGTTEIVIRSWLTGRRIPHGTARKMIWLLWSSAFKPENLSSPFHIATSGRLLMDNQADFGKGS